MGAKHKSNKPRRVKPVRAIEGETAVYTGLQQRGNIVKSRGEFIGYNQAGRKVGKYATAAEAMRAVLAAPATAS